MLCKQAEKSVFNKKRTNKQVNLFTKSTTEYYLMIISNPLFKFGGNKGNFKKVINYLKTLTTENYLRWFPKLYESTFLLLFRHDGNNIRNVWSLMLFNFLSCLYLKTYWFECVLASTLPFVNFDSGSNANIGSYPFEEHGRISPNCNHVKMKESKVFKTKTKVVIEHQLNATGL